MRRDEVGWGGTKRRKKGEQGVSGGAVWRAGGGARHRRRKAAGCEKDVQNSESETKDTERHVCDKHNEEENAERVCNDGKRGSRRRQCCLQTLRKSERDREGGGRRWEEKEVLGAVAAVAEGAAAAAPAPKDCQEQPHHTKKEKRGRTRAHKHRERDSSGREKRSCGEGQREGRCR